MSPTVQQPSAARWSVRGLRPRRTLDGVFFLHGLLFASWAAHIPHVKSALHLTDSGLGLCLLGSPIGSVSAMAVGAWLLPRIGSRRMVAVCLAGYAIAGPFVGLAGSAAGLFAALLFWGAFQGTLDVAMNTQAVTQEQAAAQPIMSGLHGRWSLGALAGAGAGALGVGIGLSLTTQLIILGVLALGFLVFTRALLDDPPRAKREAKGDAASEPAGPRRRFAWSLALLGAVALASFLCEGAAADWSAVYLRDSAGASKTMASLGYAGFALAMVAVRLRADWLFARRDAGLTLSWLAATATAGFAAALITGNPVVGLIGLLTLGGGLAAVVPTAFSAAGRQPGVASGTGIAIVSACGWAGFVLGPPLIGQLAAASSLRWALVTVPVLTAFIAVAARTPLVRRSAAVQEGERAAAEVPAG